MTPLTWIFLVAVTLTSLGTAINCVVETLNGPLDLSVIGTGFFETDVSVNNQSWVNVGFWFSPCKTVPAPDGTAPCQVDNENAFGFLQQLQQSSNDHWACTEVWNDTLPDGSWTWSSVDGGFAGANFVDYGCGAATPCVASVTIGCNPNATSLQSQSPVVVTTSSTQILYQFNLVSSALCLGTGTPVPGYRNPTTPTATPSSSK